jgi:hypothetical protein
MSNQFKGTAHIVGAEEVKSDKFKARRLVVKDDSGKFVNYVEFQFTQDRCDKLNGINVGDEITVDYNLRGREWTSPQGEVKYFNTLDGWKVEVNSRYTPSSAPAQTSNDAPGAANEPNDLGF